MLRGGERDSHITFILLVKKRGNGSIKIPRTPAGSVDLGLEPLANSM